MASIDMEEGREGEVARYLSPGERWEMTFPAPQNARAVAVADWRQRFFAIPFEDRRGAWQPRYYQENAITKVLEAVADSKDRIQTISHKLSTGVDAPEIRNIVLLWPVNSFIGFQRYLYREVGSQVLFYRFQIKP